MKNIRKEVSDVPPSAHEHLRESPMILRMVRSMSGEANGNQGVDRGGQACFESADASGEGLRGELERCLFANAYANSGPI